jgi:hypothetical protein
MYNNVIILYLPYVFLGEGEEGGEQEQEPESELRGTTVVRRTGRLTCFTQY